MSCNPAYDFSFLSPIGNELSWRLRHEEMSVVEAEQLVSLHQAELGEIDSLWLSFVQAVLYKDDLARKRITEEFLNSGEPVLLGIGLAEQARGAQLVLDYSRGQFAQCRQILSALAEEYSSKLPPSNTIAEKWLHLALDSLAVLEALSSPVDERQPDIVDNITRVEKSFPGGADFLSLTRKFLARPDDGFPPSQT